METTQIPLYLDWSFWAVAVSAIAIILSQLPPIHILVKKAKLELELYSKISITHKMGNPNLQLHLIVGNVGGRKTRIKNICVTIERDDRSIVTLPAQNYLQNQTDQNTLLFTTFSLKPGEEWAHIANFLNFFGRDTENEYRKLEQNMLSNYREKKSMQTEELKSPIELDAAVVEPFYPFFEKHFIWRAGEYNLSVKVDSDRKSANIVKRYRFTIFESHEEQLKAIKEQFKYGGGIWWDPNITTNVILEIKEA